MEFFDAPPAPTEEMLIEAKKLRDNASRSIERGKESFQRSDTDGFLSQWSHGISAELHSRNAEILEGGGCLEFPVLVYNGEVIATKVYTFQNKHASWKTVSSWKIPDHLVEKIGRKWIPVGENSRIQKKLGLRQETRWFPAVAYITSSGTGLSGCATAFVSTKKKRDY